MPQCTAPGCSFFAPEGGVYCSKHFNELATPQEKAEQQRRLTEGKQQVEDARRAFDTVLAGPVEAAKAAWSAVCAMPGFRASWVSDEITRCARTGQTNQLALWCLEEGDYVLDGKQVFEHKGLRPLLAYLQAIVCQWGNLDSATSPRLDVVLSHRSMVPWSAEANPNGSIPATILGDALYGLYHVNGPNAKLAVVQRLLPFVKIDKDLIDKARFTCKKPANVPTPEKLAIVKLIEDAAKERRAGKSDAQRAQEEAAQAAALAAEAAALDAALADASCRFVAQVAIDGIPQRLDVWTCGAYATRCRHVNAAASPDDTAAAAPADDAVVVDHEAHATCPQIQSLRRRCVRATLSAQRWQPQHQTQQAAAYGRWRCFPVHREALLTQFGVAAEQLATMTPADVVSAIGDGVPVRTPAQRKRSRPDDEMVLVKKLWAPDGDAIWFHPRWYSGFGDAADAEAADDDDERLDGSTGVDAELAARCTATTKAFQATLQRGTAGTQLNAYHIGMDVYSPTLLLVGAARDAADGGDDDAADAMATDETAAMAASATAPRGGGAAASKKRGRGGKTAAAAAAKEPHGVEQGVVVLLYADSDQSHYEGGSN
eukprot:gene11325-8051_t